MNRTRNVSILLSLAFGLALPMAAVAAGTGTAKSTTAAVKATPATTGHHAAKSEKSAWHNKAAPPKVDLNTASRETLMTLPGIDGVIADKIIAARPLHSKDQLVKEKVVTEAQYAKFRNRVTAHQSTMESNKEGAKEAPRAQEPGPSGGGN